MPHADDSNERNALLAVPADAPDVQLSGPRDAHPFIPTKQMHRVLQAYLQPEHNTWTAVAKAAKVNRRTLYDWFENPDFMAWFYGQLEKLLGMDYRLALRTTARLAIAGSPDHMKLLMHKFGDMRHGNGLSDGQSGHGGPQIAVNINVPRPVLPSPTTPQLASGEVIDVQPSVMPQPTSTEQH